MRFKFKKIHNYLWEVEPGQKPCMRVPARIYASSKMLNEIEEGAIEQAINVACLPGILKYSIAMPDIHYGYGFPIGGVAATDANEGVISPGGVGYDINCGVRLLKTDLTLKDVKPRIKELIDTIFKNVPSGVGRTGKIKVSISELDEVLRLGAKWCVENGYGYEKDLEFIEEKGQMKYADPDKVSNIAKRRGMEQIGTLGSGNHFLEVQYVEEIYEPEIAKVMGIYEVGQITIMVHTGSRGLGHQVCTDYLQILERAIKKYGIKLPDRELACAPVNSPEGQDYFKAMCAAANYAFANRQAITHWVRESFEQVFGKDAESLGIAPIYDVAHNMAKLEEHIVDGRRVKVYVHRKGATRAFPKNHPEIPGKYRSIGQPVLIPGDMGRASYVLVGTERAMQETFGSTCHGAGRVLSREKAKRIYRGERVIQELANQGIYVRVASKPVAAEEAPGAYKNVSDVVEVCHNAGISIKVAKLRPIGVAKG